jgi:hypothetical protein
MDKIDPQVQIRIIDLADKWSLTTRPQAQTESYINAQAKLFDQAYKAIIKTLVEK